MLVKEETGRDTFIIIYMTLSLQIETPRQPEALETDEVGGGRLISVKVFLDSPPCEPDNGAKEKVGRSVSCQSVPLLRDFSRDQ